MKMVINYNDSHDIQKLIGKKTASQIHWFPKSRHYAPPAFNIIGNTKYQELSQKSYIRGNTDLVLQVAKQLEEQGISFSGRVYNQNRATLTVQDQDQEKVLRFYHDTSEKRAAQHQAAAALETVDISLPNLPQQTFDEILPYLKQTDISFSARAEKDHCIFSISQKDTGIFYQALVQAKFRSEFHKSLKELGFTEQQDALFRALFCFSCHTGSIRKINIRLYSTISIPITAINNYKWFVTFFKSITNNPLQNKFLRTIQYCRNYNNRNLNLTQKLP
ncbi:hypothetical protein [Ruminococcus sp.]|uniref:hypothetical protein n=1 Tax=Ruminococcus sp. TaxID=41978 RepID=UPI003994CF34